MALQCETTIYSLPALTPLQEGYHVGENDRLPLSTRAIYFASLEIPFCDCARLQNALTTLCARHNLFQLVVDSDSKLQFRDSPFVVHVNEEYLPPGTDKRTLSEKLAKSKADIISGDWGEFQSSPLIVSVATEPNRTSHVQFGFRLIYIDGPSLRIFFKELDLLYRDPDYTFIRPAPSYLEQLRVFEADREGKRYIRAKDYWLKKIEELPLGPELPLKGSDLSGASADLTRRHVRFPPGVLNRLIEVSDTARVSPTALLLTLYGEVISKWAASPHFMISMMAQAFRARHPEAKGVVGNLSSMLPVELDFRQPSSLAEKARVLNRRLTESLLYSDVCGIEVLKWKNRRDGTISRPASPVAFVADLQGGTAEGEQYYFSSDPAWFTDSALQTPQILIDHQAIRTGDGSLQLHWDFAEQSLAPDVGTMMFERYCELVLRVANEPEIITGTYVDLLPPQQRRRRELTNATKTTVDDRLLHHLFFDSVAMDPTGIAIEDGDQTFTYGELSHRALELSARLIENGVKEGDRVALLIEKGWRQVVAVLAVLNCRAAYVPVDPCFPTARVSSIMKAAEPKVVLAERVLPELSERVIIIDELLADGGPEAEIDTGVSPERLLAYVIFTSGSTGTPKGVMLNHQGPVNTIIDVNRRFGMTCTDRVLALSALNFDLSVWDIFGTFAAGATLVFPKRDTSPIPVCWLETVEEKGITVWNSAPALLQMAVEYVRANEAFIAKSMRLVMVSGDWVPTDLPGKAEEIGWDVTFVAMGGATEASIWSNFHVVDEVPPEWSSIPYGRPLSNQCFHVLDELLEPRPEFVTGELYIGGLGVGMGYLGQQELTDTSFIVHPETGERLYRTGDLGRYLENGEIEFIGRRDQQVKIQGYRIELGDIEAALSRHNDVRSAVVIPVGAPGQSRSLCAYVVCEKGAAPEKQKISAFLHKELPAYMVPPVIVFLDEMPLSPNGKVDRKRLPSPETELIMSAGDSAIEGDIEKNIAAVWQEVLHCPIPHADIDFFSNGGDSLSAVLMIAGINERLGVDIPLSMLSQYTTVSSLANYVREKKTQLEVRSSLVVHIAGSEVNQPLFLIHPAGGTTLCYTELAGLLAPYYCVYGIQAAGTLPGRDPIGDMMTMASVYLGEVRKITRDREFVLGGWSFGGVVSSTMAAMLRDEPALLAGVVMIDSPTPNPERFYTEQEQLDWFFSDLLGGGDSKRMKMGVHSGEVKISHDGLFFDYFCEAKRQKRLPEAANADTVRKLYNTFKANLSALNNHRPEVMLEHSQNLVIKASADIIQPFAEHPFSHEHDWGWSRHITVNRCVTLLEDHYSIMAGPAIQIIAKEIADFFGKSKRGAEG